MDTVGTVFVSLFCGPVYGVSCALLSSLTNAVFDPFALPFIPNGIVAAVFASLLRSARFEKTPLLLKNLVVSLPCSIVSACISAYVFGGITSAASSYIVQFLYGVMHLPLVASAFIVQIGTDYLDKLIILAVVTLFIARIPTHIKEKI
jgi:energy-coupling factor transport system substrate-specific component